MKYALERCVILSCVLRDRCYGCDTLEVCRYLQELKWKLADLHEYSNLALVFDIEIVHTASMSRENNIRKDAVSLISDW